MIREGLGHPESAALVGRGESGKGCHAARFDGKGRLLWARRGGTRARDAAARDSADAVAISQDGSTIVTGRLAGGASVFSDGAQKLGVEAEMFIARYTADGKLEYLLGGGGADSDVSSFADGSFAVTARFTDTKVWGAGNKVQKLSSRGNNDIVVARYRRDGELAFAVQIGGDNVDFAGSIETFDNGTMLVTGTFRDRATFGAAGNEKSFRTIGDTVWVARLRGDGTLENVIVGSNQRRQRALAFGLARYADGSWILTGDVRFAFRLGDKKRGVDVATDDTLDGYVLRANADDQF